ncbi:MULTISPECIES: YigZ family protein [Anaerostipes]|uniref:YigZ family protein n=1 Tax=Anaerostipes TaxID=207244 RepID=UPI0009510F34|nr:MULTISPECIES: YigZ family protein [Anaerostipes]MCI5623692.1 YigZ family protein [Anaerostipes sp.]MDY2726366.1 YigZ family protein [Anaerostipes faecalis]OLR60218.1 YigZ family protein [Anaerostipes sp. 494a]
MEKQSYKAVYEGGEAEIVEKKSRFIAHVAPAKTEEEALEFIEKIKKQYWDARHNCTAYCIGVKQPVLRCSDDGEPSGTAGKPILEVIQGEELHNVVIVVTRYFGGTLLGTGGLIRAYTKSTQEGIRNSKIITKKLGQKMQIQCDYTMSGKIQYLISTEQIPLLGTDYTEVVDFELMIPVEQIERIKKQFIEVSSGKITIIEKEKEFFAEIDGQVKILE